MLSTRHEKKYCQDTNNSTGRNILPEQINKTRKKTSRTNQQDKKEHTAGTDQKAKRNKLPEQIKKTGRKIQPENDQQDTKKHTL